jgi:hypothetical protein
VTLRALAGLAVLQCLYVAVGACVLFALRGWSVRLLGLGYVLGIATLGVAWTILLAAGVPFGPATILLTAALTSAGGVAVGVRRGFRFRRPGLSFGRAALVAAAGVAAAAVYLEALFRAARLLGVFSFDGWAFWVTRGKAVYFFHGFDEQVFRAVPHPSYPPVVPILDAAAFHAMGGVDVVTLHVQYWALAVGFVAAAAGVLSRHVPPWALWPSLVLVLVLPRARSYLLAPQADLLLDYLVVLGATLVALWLLDRDRAWRLHAATILLCGAVLVKREGLVLAGCVLVAALAATAPSWRRAWPQLVAPVAAVVLVSLPWSIWHRAHGIDGELGADGLRDVFTGRTLDSLRLALDVVFDSGRWSVVPTIGLAAVVLAAVFGSRRLAAFVGVLVVLLTLSGASTSVVFPDIAVTADEAVNPIVRLTAATVVTFSCLTPLLLAGVWRGRRTEVGE